MRARTVFVGLLEVPAGGAGEAIHIFVCGDEVEGAGEEAEVVEEMQGVEEEDKGPKKPEKQRVVEAKEELARVASMVQEDPEENVSFPFARGCEGTVAD